MGLKLTSNEKEQLIEFCSNTKNFWTCNNLASDSRSQRCILHLHYNTYIGLLEIHEKIQLISDFIFKHLKEK